MFLLLIGGGAESFAVSVLVDAAEIGIRIWRSRKQSSVQI